MNLLIAYVYLYNHTDPLFQEFTYGECGKRSRKLKEKLKKGDYVFFHTSTKGKKYITAYYVVESVMDTSEVVEDENILAKYKNPHILEFPSEQKKCKEGNVILFGDPIRSRVLDRPLPFSRNLAAKLSLDIKFPKVDCRTETQVIGSATRQYRELNDRDVKIILNSIKSSEKKGLGTETILSSEEVTEIIEKDIEEFIKKDSTQIGTNLKLKGRQIETPVGRIDLLFEDNKGNPIIVEMKLNKIGRDALNQLKRYMNWAKKETKKEVRGAIVCNGVMPAFVDDFRKRKDIKIFCYGWQLKVNLWD